MLYLLRHGQSNANLSKRYCGITDVELSPLGVKQAKEAALHFKGINVSKIYSSPLKRAYNTAEAVSQETGVQIKTEECLKEVNFGISENKTWDELVAQHKSETDNWIKLKHKYKFPMGEGYEDIIKRISVLMDKVEDNSVIVSHFGVIQSILLYYKIADDESIWDYVISNCDIVVLNNKKLERIIKTNTEVKSIKNWQINQNN